MAEPAVDERRVRVCRDLRAGRRHRTPDRSDVVLPAVHRKLPVRPRDQPRARVAVSLSPRSAARAGMVVDRDHARHRCARGAQQRAHRADLRRGVRADRAVVLAARPPHAGVDDRGNRRRGRRWHLVVRRAGAEHSLQRDRDATGHARSYRRARAPRRSRGRAHGRRLHVDDGLRGRVRRRRVDTRGQAADRAGCAVRRCDRRGGRSRSRSR